MISGIKFSAFDLVQNGEQPDYAAIVKNIHKNDKPFISGKKKNNQPQNTYGKNGSSVLTLIQKYAVPGTKAAVY